MKSVYYGTVAVAALVLAGASQQAVAQSIADVEDAEEASPPARGTNVIVVTARKREEILQDVPISITAIGEDLVAQRNNVAVSELASAVPNVTFSSGPLPAVTVRGITGQARNNPGFDSGISVYIDGVVQGKSFSFDQAVYDIDRVEFLRGPQGTLFGRNSVAGAINIITKNPSFTPEGEVELLYGSFDRVQAEGFVTAPISDTLAVSFGGFILNQDGIATNLFDGQGLGTEDSYGGRAKLLWRPSDAVQLVLAADFLEVDAVRYQGEIISGYGSPTGRYESNISLPAVDDRYSRGISLTADIETSFGPKITSITAFRSAETIRTSDTDVGPLAVVDSASDWNQDQFSQEIRFAGSIGESLDYLVGGYIFTQETDNSTASTFGNIPEVFGFIRGLTGNTFGSIDTESYAVFGSLDWYLSDTITLTAGLRYTDEKKTLNYQQIGFPFLAPSLPQEVDSFKSDDLSPTFTVSFEPNENVLFYATASRGFKSGGWNVDNITSFAITSFSQLRFLDESVWNYEAGIKTQFWRNRGTFNISGFYQDYRDIQTSQLTPVLGGGGAVVSIVSNAATARVKGIEAEIALQPIDTLTLNGSLGYTNAEYEDYVDGAVDFEGNRLPGAPEWTANFSANYRQPVAANWDVGVRGEYIFVSSVFGDRENTLLRRTPSLNTVNGSLGIYGDHFDLVGFVNNIFDKETVLLTSNGGFPFPGVGINTIVQRRVGRTFGLRLTGRF